MKKKAGWIKIIIAIILAAAFMPVFGCGEETGSASAFHIFYLNENKNSLVPKAYELKSDDTEGKIQEIIKRLEADSQDVEYTRLFSDDIKIEKYEYEDHMLKLYFNKKYSEMKPVEEILCRGGIARTFLQLEEITGVSFYVDRVALTNANNEVVGVMTRDSFVDNPGEEIKNVQESDVTLYFATENGRGLVKETQKVYSSSNVSVEKLVVERLMDGPQSSNAKRTIPEGTQLINVSVLEGVCLVNFDKGFLVHDFEVSEPVVIYSIVDSLTALPSIDTVQISVNGETNMIYREKYSLSVQYQQDLDLVTEENEDVKIVNEEKKEAR
ncbi:Spore germination protein [uncultured Roseburia sp.]|uniref:GerMN domain-containing protein n=1 Tax=Brotonthovivens ammoniilytica TaxID=2981725 RepID=A0ABT2TMG5_9FIRM|nr:GerMN domain-containing protein [Brotonthovivens ammoniilytica]MCU6763419.1 GerMN domain-containing protein [Brotonthovivens ammoniilytica]SCJ18607.1 Spore germination protein [uncultured Roseburia sp.]